MIGARRPAPGRHLVWLASVRHLRRHPWQLSLSLAGITLGIAVVVAVQVTTASARRSFVAATQAVGAGANYQVIGGPRGVPDAVYTRLRLAGIRRIWPVVEATLAVRAPRAATVSLLGIDPLSMRGAARASPAAGLAGRVLREFLVQPGSVVVTRATARELGARKGDRLYLRHRTTGVPLRVVGYLQPADPLAAAGLRGVLVADIATAQALLGRPTRLTRIEMRVPAGAPGERMLEHVRRLLPPGLTLARSAARVRATWQLTHAFEFNLQMLSLLALMVGAFLIYNTLAFAVVQRRPVYALVRALGAHRATVLRLVLLEALMLGLAGSVLGIALGVALAHLLLDLVTRTINDLYFHLGPSGVSLGVGSVLEALALGAGVSVLAAAVPAGEATGVTPGNALRRSRLERDTRAAVWWALVAATACGAAGFALLWLPGDSLAVAFLALFTVVLAFSLAAPAFALGASRALAAPARAIGGVSAAHAVRGIGAGLSRHGVAVAALAVAVAASLGVGTMIGSFRDSVADWLHTTLRADFYVGVPGHVANRTLSPRLIEDLRAQPGVAALSLGRRFTVQSPGGPVQVLALRMAPQSRGGFALLEGEPGRVWPAFAHGRGVLVSESFAFRHGTGPGSTLRLRTAGGLRAFEVLGVYRDYGSEAGVVLMPWSIFADAWGRFGPATAGVYAAPGVALGALGASLRALVAGEGAGVTVRSSAAIRTASLEVFDRTFTITRVLRWLVVLVAFVGVLSALMALQLERGREVAVLRAQGMSRTQVWWLVEVQTGVLGLIAGLLALPLGTVIGALLVWVINHRSFGWTLELHLTPWPALEGLVTAVLAALLAGIYPAYRMARSVPARGLREE